MARRGGSPSVLADRLASLASDSGHFAILAIDHGKSLLSHLGRDADHDDGALRATKGSVLHLLAPYCTAVLVDVHVAGASGTLWSRPEGVGLIVGIDEFDYDDVTFPPPSPPSPELLAAVGRCGAGAAKIVLYYDPEAPDAAARRQAVARIVDQCHAEGLPLLVEPLPIPTLGRGVADPWPAARVAAEVAETGPDILKLPLDSGPGAAETAAAVTRAAGGTPWILLSSGAPYSDFLDMLRAALVGGAAGFAAGRSIWGDLVADVTSGAEREAATRRLSEAVRLTTTMGV